MTKFTEADVRRILLDKVEKMVIYRAEAESIAKAFGVKLTPSKVEFETHLFSGPSGPNYDIVFSDSPHGGEQNRTKFMDKAKEEFSPGFGGTKVKVTIEEVL